MPLSQANLQKLQSHMQTIGLRPACQVCGTNNWTTGEIVAPPVILPGGSMAIGGPTVPMVLLICQRCGYVMHFAAQTVGLVI